MSLRKELGTIKAKRSYNNLFFFFWNNVFSVLKEQMWISMNTKNPS